MPARSVMDEVMAIPGDPNFMMTMLMLVMVGVDESRICC